MDMICDCCGRRFPAAAFYQDDRFRICDACYRRSYTRCECCRRMIHREDAFIENGHIYCFSCDAKRFRWIHPHDYRPAPIFYGGIPRYFGVELELDGGGHNDENARILLSAVNTDAEYIYIKTDSSLRDGLEIATHPMRMHFHQHCFAWETLLQIASELGYHADDTPTSGLHIHINRSSLGNTPILQEAAVMRLIAFMRENWEQLFRISRRRTDSPVRNAWTKPLPDDLTRLRNPALGLTHADTVELRFFQSTLHLPLLYDALKTADALCEMAASCQQDAMTWERFCALLQ